ncbi:MAG: hypothetical protein KJ604_20480 [Gammaproteobacteria bacterium]|nr:hypothetical protein [Gammaproteobacteria bacterium]
MKVHTLSKDTGVIVCEDGRIVLNDIGTGAPLPYELAKLTAEEVDELARVLPQTEALRAQAEALASALMDLEFDSIHQVPGTSRVFCNWCGAEGTMEPCGFPDYEPRISRHDADCPFAALDAWRVQREGREAAREVLK